LIIDILVIIEW